MDRFRLFSSSTTLFIADDIRELITTYPPQDGPGLGREGFTPDNPFLISSKSNHDLIKSSWACERLQEILENERGRVPVTLLASSLDVGQDVVPSLLTHLNEEAYLSGDRSSVLTRSERSKLAEQFKLELRASLVSPVVFSKENDITSASTTKLVEEVGNPADDDLRIWTLVDSSGSEYIYCETFVRELRESLDLRIAEALQDLKSVDLNTAKSPNADLTRDILSRLPRAREGRLEAVEGRLVFVPQASLRRELDAELEKLRSGEIAHQELGFFYARLPDEPATPSALEGQLSEESRGTIIVLTETVFSNPWLDRLADEQNSQLESQGWLEVDARIPSIQPRDRQSIILRLTEILKSKSEPRIVLTTDSSALRCIVEKSWLTRLITDLTSLANQEARKQWHQPRKPTPDAAPAEPKFNLSVLVEQSVASDVPQEFQQLLLPHITNPTETAFAATIKSLASSAHAALEELWTDRIATRVSLHTEAADALRAVDFKLHAQLRDTLHSYLLADAVPDLLSRASARNLLSTKKTWKEAERLRSALAAHHAEQSTSATASKENKSGGKHAKEGSQLSGSHDPLQTLLGHLETFARKLAIAEPTSEQLATRKRVLVAEIVARMQRDHDGARLLLSLLIVLCAETQAGVVYATGKMAPRLLKALKALGDLDEQQGEQLEALKEDVRAGKMVEDERNVMKAWARDVGERIGREGKREEKGETTVVSSASETSEAART